MAGRLHGKRAVVTGASTGIGAAIARAFAAEGARVVVHYGRSRERAEEVVAECRTLGRGVGRGQGGDAMAIQADIARREDVHRLVHEAYLLLGGVDIWANIAGADILTGAGAELPDHEKLALLLSVDLLGTMECCWQVAPRMKADGGGAILNMSWDLALSGMSGRNPEIFAAVKGGITGFSKCLALSWAPEVRVNDLAPGWIATTFAEEVMTTEYYEHIVAATPLARFGRPEDVARAAVFLVSDEAAFLTAQTLKINGGLSS
jgi:3-oxoacyl-[acyl-carrier protein] reductase